MKSNAKTVAAYLKELPKDRMNVLKKFRELCLAILVGYEESMMYGMPCYSRNEIVEVAFASQKNFISLYFLKQGVIKSYQPSLANIKIGKGCIRYTKPEQIDFEIIKKMLLTTIQSAGNIC